MLDSGQVQPTLTDVYRYPVKSRRGERGVVEPWGLAGDRRWMVVDAAGEPVRLVYLDDPSRRRPNPARSREFGVSVHCHLLADEGPLAAC